MKDDKTRKETPIYSGFIKYFPLAIAEVARTSVKGNIQHLNGQELHWDKTKSNKHLDSLQRHVMDAGKIDTDGVSHSAKIAWRAMANLEIELEKANDIDEDYKSLANDKTNENESIKYTVLSELTQEEMDFLLFCEKNL